MIEIPSTDIHGSHSLVDVGVCVGVRAGALALLDRSALADRPRTVVGPMYSTKCGRAKLGSDLSASFGRPKQQTFRCDIEIAIGFRRGNTDVGDLLLLVEHGLPLSGEHL